MKPRLKAVTALTTTFLTLIGCGGGGGGGAPAGGGALPPAAGDAPVASVSIPFAAGKRWHYNIDRTNAVTGVPALTFTGERLLHVGQELTWQGRTAWKLQQYDLKNNPGASPGFEVATIYVSQDADGLDKWVDRSTGGEWRRILSTQSLMFNQNTFLMAGGPTHSQGTEMSSPWPISVPAGNFLTTLAYHEFRQTGSFASEDIFEERWEYYADGVGLIRAAWSYSKDDNDPSATDESSVGTVDLKGIDAGPAVITEIEPNDGGTAATSQAVSVGSIVAAQTHIDDDGRILVDANVAPNINNEKLIQDWYRLVLSTSGPRHIALVYDIFNDANEHFDDLDLYLFREGTGTLTFVDASALDPTTNAGREGEWIQITDLAAGTYYLAVQAWGTPTDAVPYWIAIR